jgi:hypothetical protein
MITYQFWRSSVVRFKPAYFLVNRTSHPILYTQANSQYCSVWSLDPEKQIPFHFPDPLLSFLRPSTGGRDFEAQDLALMLEENYNPKRFGVSLSTPDRSEWSDPVFFNQAGYVQASFQSTTTSHFTTFACTPSHLHTFTPSHLDDLTPLQLIPSRLQITASASASHCAKWYL